jgi:TPR repeat protein
MNNGAAPKKTGVPYYYADSTFYPEITAEEAKKLKAYYVLFYDEHERIVSCTLYVHGKRNFGTKAYYNTAGDLERKETLRPDGSVMEVLYLDKEGEMKKLHYDKEGNIIDEKFNLMGEGYNLSDTEVKALQDKALNGDPKAAFRLSLFYDIYRRDYKEGDFWTMIAAENGDPSGEYNFGFKLKDDPDPKNRQRAIFWLKRAAKHGVKLAVSLLKELQEESSKKSSSKSE